MKILTIVGNRPQFIKLGVTARALRELGDAAPFDSVVVNTGQHYDQMLSDVFFNELEIEPPKYDLAMGSGHIVDQIGKMLQPIREILEGEAPDALLVYGDTNSTIAGAIAAGHFGIPVIHVEGGERLYRRLAMPEEVNRVVTDHLSSLCLSSSRKAVWYLGREGFSSSRAIFVGDPMYDIFKLSGSLLETKGAKQPLDFGLETDKFALCTIHRAENTDDQDVCIGFLNALDGADLPVLLPAHPRLLRRIESWGWRPRKSLQLVDPLGYFDFQSLLRQSALIITDSGGVGREAFFAGKPAIIPLESTAWIEAVEAGAAITTGRSPKRLAAALASPPSPSGLDDIVEYNFGQGDAGYRIVEAVAEFVGNRGSGEDSWHSIGRFEDLPTAVDSSALSHDVFRTLASQLAQLGKEAPRIVLDLTSTIEGALPLALIASEYGLELEIFVDLDEANYNFFSGRVRERISEIQALGHRVSAPNFENSSILNEALSCGSHIRDIAQLSSDTDENGNPNPSLTLADKSKVDGFLIHPYLWHEIPVSPFESRLRATDLDHQRSLADTSQAFAVR